MRIISARRANKYERATYLEAQTMKKHYDFSKAVQGKLYRPAKSLQIPILS